MKSGWVYTLAAVVLLALAFGAYVAMPVAETMAKAGVDQSRSRMTDNGLYVASIEPEAGRIKQGELHAWILTVKTAGGQPVNDAKVTVDGGMPDHNHGLPTSPEMTGQLGEGRYRIEGVKFSMPGWWELRFDIVAMPGPDSVTFNLVL